MTVEDLAEMVIAHMEFHGLDSELYLPDPQNFTHLCYIVCEDSGLLQATLFITFDMVG